MGRREAKGRRSGHRSGSEATAEGAETALIGLDWGTSTLRAWRIDAAGHVLERRTTEDGILSLVADGFEKVFSSRVGSWLAKSPAMPVIASGMITSRQGWIEAPYLDCPAGASDLAAGLVAHFTQEGHLIRFVPGLSRVAEDGVPDVMRGEETQIVGALEAGYGSGLLVLPGTHSKWALAQDGRVVWFATFMTGELFGLLKQHSILGRMMQGDRPDETAFGRGLAYARAGRGGAGTLLSQLFSARTLALFEQIPESGVESYVSGLLIGAEIAEALATTAGQSPAGPVVVIGDAALATLYVGALNLFGLKARSADQDACARGQYMIARAAGLIGEAG